MSEPLVTIDNILGALRASCPVILIDDEDRENEGDVILPLAAATAERIHFLMMHCRGMICLAMDEERAGNLGLQSARARGIRVQYDTPFMRSIDARNLPDRGCSAVDLSATIQAAGRFGATANDFVSPGHIAPLAAKPGGVLVRAGHTEASVDLARLAGLPPFGVLCEIMHEDGTMARGENIKAFAKQHGMPVFSIAQLIAWRLKHDRFVTRTASGKLTNQHGTFDAHVYHTSVPPYREHLVLSKGIGIGGSSPSEIPIVRVHMLDILSDACQDSSAGRHTFLDQAFRYLARHKSGALLLIQQSSHSELAKIIAGRTKSPDSVEANGQLWLREYGIGAQILLDMGITRMRLLSHSSPSLVAFSGFGITISERIHFPVPTP